VMLRHTLLFPFIWITVQPLVENGHWFMGQNILFYVYSLHIITKIFVIIMMCVQNISRKAWKKKATRGT
jgi:Ca2+/H+ antiporter